MRKYIEIFKNIDDYLKSQDIKPDTYVMNAVESRKNGKTFSFSEHLSGLVFSLLSNQRDWKAICENRDVVEDIFYNFDREKIKNADYKFFVSALKEKQLGNRAINQQMKSLKYNISVLEKLEQKYLSLDNFILKLKPDAIAALLACPESPYSLKQVGFSLALEYLRNVGVDTVKPDTHVKRILGRLNLLKNSEEVAEKETMKVIENLSINTGFSKVYIDFLLWHFCADGYGNICSKIPKCSNCVIKKFCSQEAI